MRDAFGGAFMIRLFLVFIFIYMFFTAIALNYAKAFKVKNKVIDYIEDHEIIDMISMPAIEKEKMESYFEEKLLGDLNYRISKNSMPCNNEDRREVYCENGIRIIQLTANSIQANKLGTYYRVDTYFSWNLSFMRKITALSNQSQSNRTPAGIWVISGETRTIVNE